MTSPPPPPPPPPSSSSRRRQPLVGWVEVKKNKIRRSVLVISFMLSIGVLCRNLLFTSLTIDQRRVTPEEETMSNENDDNNKIRYYTTTTSFNATEGRAERDNNNNNNNNNKDNTIIDLMTNRDLYAYRNQQKQEIDLIFPITPGARTEQANHPMNHPTNTTSPPPTTTASSGPIRLVLPLMEREWIYNRAGNFETWYSTTWTNRHDDTEEQQQQEEEDRRRKPWIDFLIVGFPKTGTTTLMANLGQVAPMPIADMCFDMNNVLTKAYLHWPAQYDPSVLSEHQQQQSSTIIQRQLTDDSAQETVDDGPSYHHHQHIIIDDDNTDNRDNDNVNGHSGSSITNGRILHANTTASSITPPPRLWLRGSKCPGYLGRGMAMLRQIGINMPETKLIVGIRHPVLWFESFWKMVGRSSPYDHTTMCPCPPDYRGRRKCTVPVSIVRAGGIQSNQIRRRGGGDFSVGEDADWDKWDEEGEVEGGQEKAHQTNMTDDKERQQKIRCGSECYRGRLACVARGRFHLTLAQLGKTALTRKERRWLAPNDVDGGNNLVPLSPPVNNQMFLYDTTELPNDDVWQALATFLGVSHLPNVYYRDSKGRRKNSTANWSLCDPRYDYFRANQLLPYSYQVSVWMQDYFLPLATSNTGTDHTTATTNHGTNDNKTVVVTDVQRMYDIVELYKLDPCRRLILQVKNVTSSTANATYAEKNTRNGFYQGGTRRQRHRLLPHMVEYVLDPALGEEMIPPPPTYGR